MITFSLFSVNIPILYRELLIVKNDEGAVIDNITYLTGNLTFEDSERLNYKWELDEKKNLYFQHDDIFGWFSYTGLNPNKNNTLRIMSFGNSWTTNHAKIMYEECGPKLKEFLRGSISGCEPIYKFPSEFKNCSEFLVEVEQHLEVFKPDYAFHMTRSVNIGNNYTDDFENDPIYQSILNETRYMVKHIKHKLFILNSIPSVDRQVIKHLTEYLKNNVSKDEIDTKMYMSYDKHVAATKRYAQLIKDCGSKCELIDYYDFFHPNGIKTYRYYDENGLLYMTPGSHLSSWAFEYLRPFWKHFCANKIV
ncbi:unnamed protein product [Caenorhabditis angaria]|uniref:SGNH domain-containing protein n=1 Tax=Caenorhabditis angaria TaxID=860376 RepID=A0A9P1I6U1_9PELO|nr:unnamed protein product [Caenorhabditis angaria]